MKQHQRKLLSLLLVAALLCGLVLPAARAASSGYEVVEGWTSADLSSEKYTTANCTITAGTDETIGGYVAMKASNYGPTLTISYSFDITKYTDPTVGFWLKQAGTTTGNVYLQSAGTNVAEATFTPVADTWIFVTVALTAAADAIQFAPNPYGNPDIGSIYFGSKADVEKIPEADDAQPYEVAESWANADLTDTGKYATVNANLTLGNDETVGDYVAISATNWGPTLTVTYSFDASKYTEPTVGFWLRQSGTSTGEVKLLSAGEAVGTLTFEPVAGEWIFVTLALTASADSIQFAPNPYGNPDIGSIYFGSKADVEKIPQAGDAQPYEVAESWTGADLTDTGKYATVNANLTLGNDETVGDYVAMKATNWGPTLTVTYSFDASKYTEPTVGFWLRQSGTSTGEVKLLSAGEAVGTLTFEPVAGEWIFVTLALTASADSIQFAPNPYGNPDIGSIYFGGKADVEKIPDGVGTTDPEPTDPEPTDPTEPTEPEEPGTPGGQGRWVLIDNYETGKLSSEYSTNEGFRIVSKDDGYDTLGQYSAYREAVDTSCYFKYDRPTDATAYAEPAIAFWAKGTQDSTVILWRDYPMATIRLNEEWTYYVISEEIADFIEDNGTGQLPYIRFWVSGGTEVYLDEIFFGEAADLAVAPDNMRDFVIDTGEELPPYISSDKIVIHSFEGFETCTDGQLPEGTEFQEWSGALIWEIADKTRMLEDYSYSIGWPRETYSLLVSEDPAQVSAGVPNTATLTLPVFDAAGNEAVVQPAITFRYLTEYNRDESKNHWQILPEQNQDLALEVSATGELWTEVWSLNEDMDDDLYNGVWYSVSVPIDTSYLAQGKLHYRFVFSSDGGNAIALDDITVEEYIAPLTPASVDIYGLGGYDYDLQTIDRKFLTFRTDNTHSVTKYDAPTTIKVQDFNYEFGAMDYGNGVVYAVLDYANALYKLDPETFEQIEIVAQRIASPSTTETIYSIAYNPVEDMLYALQLVDYTNGKLELYRVSPEDGTSTYIKGWVPGEGGPNLDNLAFDKDGTLYGVGKENTEAILYMISTDNGSAAQIGKMGVNVSGPWLDAATIDKENGILYYAPFGGNTSYGYCHLYAVDLTTARATKIGSIGNCIALTSMFIPYEPNVERFVIMATAGENGSISPSGEVKVAIGRNRTFYITPDEGCVLDTLMVDGVAVDLENDPAYDAIASTYTFTNVTEAHTISATFAAKAFTVTFVDHDGTVLDTQQVPYHTAATAPEDPVRTGYTFAGWDTDFSVVCNDLTVRATYSINLYRVIFKDWNGEVLDVQKVKYQRAAEAPAAPVREGYTFIGWDRDFSSVTENMTVTAQYTADAHEHGFALTDRRYLGDHQAELIYACTCGETKAEVESIDCPSARFTDLTQEWYHDTIDEALFRGLYQGMSETTFGPEQNITRGQFVTVLYRLAGAPKVTGNMPFADVADEQYFTDAVLWAYQEGLVNGVTANSFCPNASITREMLVTILWRLEGRPASGQRLDGFTDAGSISDYARTAMAWACESGLIQGVSSTLLAPGGTATRAQGATFVVRYARTFVD